MGYTKRKTQSSKLKAKNQTYSSKFKINSVPNLLIFLGLCFLAVGIIIPILTFSPVIHEEIIYKTNTTLKKYKNNSQIKPASMKFGIVIPKIFANAEIIKDVNPYHEEIYQKALARGVAHAEGSALPDEFGNIFLFAHSSGDWYTANQYNSVFYLLNKLEKKDEINIYYQNKKYTYKVMEKKVVAPFEIDYLIGKRNKKTLTLMTCWPPGTTLKRLIIVAGLAN